MGVSESRADPNIMQNMDNAAANAESDLDNIDEEAVRVIAEWWKQWYMKAGHKRLGRALLAQIKEQ